MMMRCFSFLIFCTASLLTSCARESQDEELYLLSDSHVHLLSPTLYQDWLAIGEEFSNPAAYYHDPENALNGVSANGKILIASMAHFYAAEWYRLETQSSEAAERENVRRENQAIRNIVSAFGAQATFYCSVPVLRPYAITALKHCHDDLQADGIKLHFGVAKADFRDPETIAELRKFFLVLAPLDVPLLLHLDNQVRGTDIEHILIFLDEVLARVPNQKIIVAHMGGSGGYGEWSQRVFAAVHDWADENDRDNIYFDISAVLLEEPSQGLEAASADLMEKFLADIRDRGTGRLVFGTDFPLTTSARYATYLVETAGMTVEELAAIRANQPWNE